MPVHPPMYVTTASGSLGVNKCYLFLIEEYTKHGRDTWELYELYKLFGDRAVDSIIEEEFLEKVQEEYAQLMFTVSGKPPARLLSLLTTPIDEDGLPFNVMDFVELQEALSAVKHCSSSKLRDYISYLMNFGLVDLINVASSTLPFVFAIQPDYENTANTIYTVSQFLDFPYIEPQEEILKEHKLLMQLELAASEAAITMRDIRPLEIEA